MLNKLKVFMGMIKFEHTLFALPFAFMGALLGSIVILGHLPHWSQIGWISLAMVGARSTAMGLNRLIDKAIDMKNPRTAGRALPAGLLSSKEVLLFIVVSFIILFAATMQLNVLSMKLLPIAVFFLVIYSYTKRFTWACHIILGLTIALAPLGGWVAVTGTINFTAIIFYFTVSFWTAGFDIIYACQDIEFDRQQKLYSIPSRFGIAKALMIARVFHFFTALGFFSLFFLTELSWWYFAGIMIAYLILIYEHQLVSANDLSKLNTAFFTMNGILSVLVFAFTWLDLVVSS